MTPAPRKPTARDWVHTGVYVGLFCAATVIGGVFVGHRPVFYVAAVCAGLALLVRWHSRAFAYKCPHCGSVFRISAWRDFISPHLATTKYLRCPNCHRREWATILKNS